MKLLTPQNTQALKEENTVREILRTQEVNKVADKTRKALANAEADFKEALARQKIRWEQEEEEHFKDIQRRKKEIDALEAKKLNALIPIGILREGVDDRMHDAVTFLAGLRLREQNAEDLTEKLQDKLDEVGQKEQDLKQLDRTLSLKKEGLDRQAEGLIHLNKRLNKEMEKFILDRDKSEKDLDKRKTDVYLIEQSLKAKENTLQRTDKALNDLARQLEDQRATLERAWNELRRREAKLSP